MPILYRIVRGRQFTIEDARSNMALCKKRRGRELIDLSLWAGISMFTTPEQAGETARVNRIGTTLARLEIPEDDPRVVLSRPGARGHVTVWACQEFINSCVHGVVPIP